MDASWDAKTSLEHRGLWTSALEDLLEAVHVWRSQSDETTHASDSAVSHAEAAFAIEAVAVLERDLGVRAPEGARLVVMDLEGSLWDSVTDVEASVEASGLRGPNVAYGFSTCFGAAVVVLEEVPRGLGDVSTPRGEAILVDATCPFDRRALLSEAAALGRESLVRELVDRTPLADVDAAAKHAISGGHVSLAATLITQRGANCSAALLAAFEYNSNSTSKSNSNLNSCGVASAATAPNTHEALFYVACFVVFTFAFLFMAPLLIALSSYSRVVDRASQCDGETPQGTDHDADAQEPVRDLDEDLFDMCETTD